MQARPILSNFGLVRLRGPHGIRRSDEICADTPPIAMLNLWGRLIRNRIAMCLCVAELSEMYKLSIPYMVRRIRRHFSRWAQLYFVQLGR